MLNGIDKYEQVERLLVALDCIIFGFEERMLKLLLIKRSFEPEKGKWSLMGGFLKKKETLDDAAKRILHTLTGLDNVFLEQLYCFGELDRDPVERTISVTYYALINIEDYDYQLSKQYGAEWFPVSDLPELIFDHSQMVETAKNRLKYKAAHHPVGFELLPEKFTMPQLRRLYEAIFEQPIDKGNFNRRIKGLDVLIRLNEKQREYSKKGAFYYKFDAQKYQALLEKGSGFLLKP